MVAGSKKVLLLFQIVCLSIYRGQNPEKKSKGKQSEIKAGPFYCLQPYDFIYINTKQ
jgi:hypothetical protein